MFFKRYETLFIRWKINTTTENLNVDGKIVNSYIIICSSGAKCPLSGWKDPTYLVEWNRFGNISKYKWNEKRNAWTRI